MIPSFLGGQGIEAGCEIPMGWDGLAILFSFWAQPTPKTHQRLQRIQRLQRLIRDEGWT